MHQCSLLIVDDDPVWLRVAAQYFSIYNFSVLTAASCSDGLKVFKSKRPDCVLLDYNLGTSNAAAFCKEVRNAEKLIRTPIVVISGEDAMEMQAYTVCQADGFVLKDCGWTKVRAIIEMVMRRVYWERGVIAVGDLRLERTNFTVFRGASPLVFLSPAQFRILYLLMQESPNFVSEDDIAKSLFDSDFAPEKEDSIRGLLQRLRKKLGPQVGRRIKNKNRLGWVYVQPRIRENQTRSDKFSAKV